MRKINAIIIDDLKDARDMLKQDLMDYCPHVSIIGEADGVVSGLKIIKKLQPELVFLDINMNDGSGFDRWRACRFDQGQTLLSFCP